MQKVTKIEKPYLFRSIKTYDAEDILAAGGTTAFGKLTNYNPKKLYELQGSLLSEEDYQKALKMLSK